MILWSYLLFWEVCLADTTAALIKEQLESTIREKKCLEQEANILRAQLEQAGMNLEIQRNNITDNIT